MKTSQIVVFASLMIMAIALGAVAVYAYSYGSSGVAGPVASNAGVSGSYGTYPNGMMGGNMGMMGGWMGTNNGASSSTQNPAAIQNPTSPILGLGLVALVGGVIAGTSGLAYFLVISKNRTAKPTNETRVESVSATALSPYVSISKTLTAEERKVLDVLVSHDGKYLQKYIRAETGLSRLKTHRIVARLAERGIVTLEKSGNTNEVRLSSWLRDSEKLEQTKMRTVNDIIVST